MIDVSVLIPWRSDGSERERSFEWNARRWESFLPDAEWIIADSDKGEAFNRSQARNNAFDACSGRILVLADADTTVSRSLDLTIAIEWVRQTGQWVLPYDIYFNLSQTDTERVLAGPVDAPLGVPDTWEFRLEDAVSGVIVLSREAFRSVGGYDEHFVGWGFEDRAFALALETMWSRPKRLPNHLLHLWHPVGSTEAFGSPSIHENQARWLRYMKAKGNRSAMSNLLVEL